MTKSNAVNKAQNSFNNSVKRILKNKSEFASTATYIQRLIGQFKLSTIFEIEEIFNEAYIRGLDYIERTGNEIKVPEAFIKRTSLNIIREKKRKQSKYQGVDTNSYQDALPADEVINDFFSENYSEAQIELLKLKLEELNNFKPQDFDLLWYSVVEDKSAKEIVKLLSTQNSKLTASTVRQRKSRTLRKLHKELVKPMEH